MGYLLHIFLALFAQGLDEEGFGATRELPFLVLAFAIVPYVLAACVRRSALKGRFSRSGLFLALLHWSPPLLHAIAVLGCGADTVYPPRHHDLAAEIAASGVLVAEYPPATAPLPL